LAEGDGGALGGGGAAEEGVGGCGPEAEGKGPSRYGLDLFVGCLVWHKKKRTRFCQKKNSIQPDLIELFGWLDLGLFVARVFISIE
jgi:hypothetical protein